MEEPDNSLTTFHRKCLERIIIVDSKDFLDAENAMSSLKKELVKFVDWLIISVSQAYHSGGSDNLRKIFHFPRDFLHKTFNRYWGAYWVQ